MLRRLSHAPRTRKELAKDLKDKDISDEVANVALDRFEEVGLINDQALASNYVSSQHERKGLGKNALRQQLRAKGISDDVALEAISQISDDQGERCNSAARVWQFIVSRLGLQRQ